MTLQTFCRNSGELGPDFRFPITHEKHSGRFSGKTRSQRGVVQQAEVGCNVIITLWTSRVLFTARRLRFYSPKPLLTYSSVSSMCVVLLFYWQKFVLFFSSSTPPHGHYSRGSPAVFSHRLLRTFSFFLKFFLFYLERKERVSGEGGADREWGKTCSTGPWVGLKPRPLGVRPSLNGVTALPGEL